MCPPAVSGDSARTAIPQLSVPRHRSRSRSRSARINRSARHVVYIVSESQNPDQSLGIPDRLVSIGPAGGRRPPARLHGHTLTNQVEVFSTSRPNFAYPPSLGPSPNPLPFPRIVSNFSSANLGGLLRLPSLMRDACGLPPIPFPMPSAMRMPGMLFSRRLVPGPFPSS